MAGISRERCARRDGATLLPTMEGAGWILAISLSAGIAGWRGRLALSTVGSEQTFGPEAHPAFGKLRYFGFSRHADSGVLAT